MVHYVVACKIYKIYFEAREVSSSKNSMFIKNIL